MNKVRISGDLLKIDNGKIRKYRCVIRSGFFFAYPNKQIDESTVMELNHFQKAEITLAVVTLTATTYILPTVINSDLTPYVLQLSCFETSQKYFFYVNCAASLESWIEAIRDEACNDDLSLDVEQGELLPPTVNDDESSLYRPEDDGSSYTPSSSPSMFSRVPHENSSVRRMLLEEASLLRNEGLLSSQVPVKGIERNQWKTWSFKHNLHVTFAEHSPTSPERSSNKEMNHGSNIRIPPHDEVYGRAHKCNGNISDVHNKGKSELYTRKLISNDATERSLYRPISTVTSLSHRIKRRNNQERAKNRQRAERPNDLKMSAQHKILSKSSTVTCGVKTCGWLHCKNSAQMWDVAWVTLTADNKLLFYDKNSTYADLNWICDLSKGCSVEHISFGKCCAAFTMVYQTTENTDRSKTSTFSSVNDSTASQQDYTKCTTRKVDLMCGDLLEFVDWMKSLTSINRKNDDDCLSVNQFYSISGEEGLLNRESSVAAVSCGARKFNTKTPSTDDHDVTNKTGATSATVNKIAVKHDKEEEEESVNESDLSSITQFSTAITSSGSSSSNDVIRYKSHHAAVTSEKENIQLNKFLSSTQQHHHRRSIKARRDGHPLLATSQSSTSTSASSPHPCESTQPTPTTLKSGKVAAAKINRDPLFSSCFTSATTTANTSTNFDDDRAIQPSFHSQLLRSRPKASSCSTGSSNSLASCSERRSSSRKHSSSDNSAAQGRSQSTTDSPHQQQQQQVSNLASSFEIKEESNLFKSWSEPCLARAADHPRRQHFSQLESSHPSLRKSLICMMRNTKPKFPELSRVEFLETYGFGSKKTQNKKFTSSKQKSKSKASIFLELESDQKQPLGTKLNSYENKKFTSSKQKSKSKASIFLELESDQKQPLGTKLNSYENKKFTSSKQKSKSKASIFLELESDQKQPLGTKLNSYDNSKKSSKINRIRNLSLRSIPSTKLMDEKKPSGKGFKKHSFRLASRPNISQERTSCKNDEEYRNYASKTVAYMGGKTEAERQHGFLSLRNKKKNWDRYWCVFLNDVLQFYDKPHSKTPTQTLPLAGYEYFADVSASTQKHFAIKAEKKGSPTYHFGTDDFEDIVAWMRRLDQKHMPKENNLDGKVKAQTLPTLCFKKEFMRRSEGDLSKPTFERSVALQKHKLLQEIEVEKKKILKELNILEKQNSGGTSPSPSTSSTPRSRKLGGGTYCNHFHLPDQEMKDSFEEEQRVTRYMALLHRRRNSQQLKIDQVSRELTTVKRPSIKKKKSRKVGVSGDKSRNGQVGPDSEAVQKQKTPLVFKLIEMRQELSTINLELKRVHTFKKSFLEKLDEKVDAENVHQQPSVRGVNQLLTKSLSHNCDHNLKCDTAAILSNTSSNIESLNSLEDPTSSSSSSSEHIGLDGVNCDRPPLCKTKSLEPTINNKIISLVEMDRNHGWKSSEYLPNPTAPNSKVDPSVLASISMFEKFSEMTLAKIKSQKSKSPK